MQMTSLKLKKILDERFNHPELRASYNRDKDSFRVEWKSTKKGITITLPNVVAKYNQKGQGIIDELEEHVKEALRIMNEEQHLAGMEKHIYPVIRSTSFPTKTNSNINLVYKDHTAETRVFYAIDLGKSYRLVDELLLAEEKWTKERIDEIATFNLRSLSVDYNHDRVADNDFYFIATQDGYDASRILNEAFLEEMKANSKGELAVAVPHQDVLIVADVQNNTGYDILAQMTMKFFAEGRIPITSLPMIYENKTLEPIFILAKNRPEKND
ncbi:MAG: DUF1444 domain-containing protein [Virgibacillus proomii]|jgi:uncharacterized protein YtpQ (UPF0354 family)